LKSSKKEKRPGWGPSSAVELARIEGEKNLKKTKTGKKKGIPSSLEREEWPFLRREGKKKITSQEKGSLRSACRFCKRGEKGEVLTTKKRKREGYFGGGKTLCPIRGEGRVLDSLVGREKETILEWENQFPAQKKRPFSRLGGGGKKGLPD